MTEAEQLGFDHNHGPSLRARQVQYNPDVTGPRDLISAVDEAGFEATLAVARCAGSGADPRWSHPCRHAARHRGRRCQ